MAGMAINSWPVRKPSSGTSSGLGMEVAMSEIWSQPLRCASASVWVEVGLCVIALVASLTGGIPKEDVMPNTAESPLATYLAHLKRGALGYQFSPSLGRAVFYPRIIAPETGAADLEWRVSKGLGTVHATTVVHPQQGAPYNVCLVDLDEGFRMMSRVEDVPPTAVMIGMRVRFRVHTQEGD